MTKIERLKKIEAEAKLLRAEIEAEAKAKKWERTTSKDQSDDPKLRRIEYKINRKWAYTAFTSSERKGDEARRENPPALYLTGCYGKWVDEDGHTVQGYLTYIPD